MSNLEKRLDALEQSAKNQAAQPTPEDDDKKYKELCRRFKEIKSRKPKNMTPEETIKYVRDGIEQMRTNWDLRNK